MPHTNGTIDKQLITAQIALTNALNDPSLQSALARYGYTAERLREGQALRERAHALHEQQRLAYSDLTSAQGALRAAQAQVMESYKSCARVARFALVADQRALQRLHLDSERKQTRSAWLVQARQFYSGALSDDAILSRLDAHGVTEQQLEAGKRQIEMVDACLAELHKQRGEARLATRVRDEALAALEEWMRQFRQNARWALKSQPQYLEKLDMAARV